MNVLRAASVVSSLTFLSRILGLARDMLTTRFLPSFYTDALFLAWTLPNMLRKLFGEGALSSAFIPAFAKVRRQGDEERLRGFVSAVITTLFLVLLAASGIALVLTWVLPEAWLLPLFQGDRESLAETLRLARILLPYMAIVCVIAQFQGVLNSFEIFAAPALAPIVLNAVWIAAVAGGYFLAPEDAAWRAGFLCFAILTGGMLQLLIFLPSLRRCGMIPRPRLRFDGPEFREVIVHTLPMALALSAVQVNILVDRMVARAYVPGDGGVTHLFIGNRIMQFPLALIGVALTTAVFPLLARLSSEGDRSGVRSTLSEAVRINLFFSIPSMAGLFLLAGPTVALFFQWDEFSAGDTQATARALIGYAAGIPFLSTVMLLTRAFYVLGRWRAPLYVSASLVGLNVALDFILVGPLAEAGVALATSIATALQAGILFILLRRILGRLGGRAIADGSLRAGVLTLLLAAAVYGVQALIGVLEPCAPGGLPDRILRVLLPMAAGMLVYLAPAALVCRREFGFLLDAVRGGRKLEENR